VLAENATLTNTTGVGLSYQTEFGSWHGFFNKMFGWVTPDKQTPDDTTAVRVAGSPDN